jgi:hypothetical protein
MPRSGPVDSPFVRQISAMQHICTKLRDFEYDHPVLKPEDMAGRSLTDYVALGVLSPQDVTYIRDHGIQFHGFDPKKIGGDVPVLEAAYGRFRKRMVGYSDASVVTYDSARTPWSATEPLARTRAGHLTCGPAHAQPPASRHTVVSPLLWPRHGCDWRRELVMTQLDHAAHDCEQGISLC